MFMQQLIMEQEYKRSLEDEIDWKVVDQLHTATLNFSTTSLELKKMFFVLVGIAVPTLIKLSDSHLDLSLFVTLYVLTITFWSLDSYTYFFQEKLREKMDNHLKNIKDRNRPHVIVGYRNDLQEFTLENSRTPKNRRWRSATNSSVALYYILFGLNTVGLTLFLTGAIK
jgi:hypothetical protein